jgi:1,4-dihydroxy-2-naphthoate octaprenyltransferase
MSQFRNIINFIRPIQLLFSLLTYGLGLGLARYLGATLSVEPQFGGGVIVILLLSTSNLLTEYFRPLNEPMGSSGIRIEREELRAYILVVSISLISTVAIMIFLLIRDGFMHAEAAIITLLFIVLASANAIPPIRLVNRGIGEILTSIQISSLTPSLAFLLQFGSLHRLLTIYTIPLFLLVLAYFLALNFPAYAEDLKYERRSMLISLTWQRAVPLHNLLLITAYLFFASIPFLGVPIELVWPAFLSLPIAAYQVYTLRNLADGAKPIWPVFITSATAIFGITSYLIALTFWLR